MNEAAFIFACCQFSITVVDRAFWYIMYRVPEIVYLPRASQQIPGCNGGTIPQTGDRERDTLVMRGGCRKGARSLSIG